MENETIEEAVGFIETATDNIRKALECDRPRDGITLEEFIQLLRSGTVLTIGLPMMGKFWKTRITVASERKDGVTRITTNSLDDLSVLKRKVDGVFVDTDELCVRLAGEDKR